MDFNTTQKTYKQIVEEAISFSGQGLDFYTNVKADAVRRIFDREKITSPRLLDLGCGHGFIHPLLTDLGCEVIAVETANEVLSLARKENPNVDYIAYDGCTLPFYSQSFDIVLTICVMHHVAPPQWLAFLKEARRVLRPTGRVIIFEHNPLNPLTRYVVSRNKIDADAVLVSHFRLNRMLKASGFKAIQSRFILFTPFSHPIVRHAETILERVPLGAQYYTTASVKSLH